MRFPPWVVTFSLWFQSPPLPKVEEQRLLKLAREMEQEIGLALPLRSPPRLQIWNWDPTRQILGWAVIRGHTLQKRDRDQVAFAHKASGHDMVQSTELFWFFYTQVKWSPSAPISWWWSWWKDTTEEIRSCIHVWGIPRPLLPWWYSSTHAHTHTKCISHIRWKWGCSHSEGVKSHWMLL